MERYGAIIEKIERALEASEAAYVEARGEMEGQDVRAACKALRASAMAIRAAAWSRLIERQQATEEA